ncbi:uncharacterized protein GO595_008554 [Histomonas meleagridis]|uniref:uncharacterized protein n=1 Tax=Histomonas meleagridis TaxID=135588 RepID=UPI00355AA090|nr:hypothetical protein GO595_008554 [Histomonas meleagridis]
MFASLCVYHMLDPYSSSFDEEVMGYALNLGKKLGDVDFGSDSEIQKIFSNTFNNLNSTQPSDFLDSLSKVLCHKYPQLILKCGELYVGILSDEIEANYTSVFSVVIAFFHYHDHNSILSSYNDIIRFACKIGTIHSYNLLYVIGNVTNDKSDERIQAIPPPYELKDEVIPIQEITTRIENVIKTIPAQTLAQGEVDLENDGSIIPMYPLLNDAYEDLDENRQLIKNLIIQPYEAENENWNKIKDIDEKSEEIVIKEQSEFDFYAHAAVGGLKALRKKDEANAGIVDEFPPEYFVVHMNEYAQYKRRIGY